ncbi:unnamed protein product [Phytomonas sp. EM1]|nr:unnamed protein product [Phytomonas sp. EM1]|eukprot:CCW63983.1 unnamed protein product [Phytomonas sp. isolate EM1]
MPPPLYIRGKGIRKATEAAVRRWQQLRFDELRDQLATKFSGELRLPIFCSATLSQPQPNPPASPYISINLRANRSDLIQWLAIEHFGFFHPEGKTSVETVALPRPLASSEVTLHVGPPKPIGYPTSIEAETLNWAEGVLRGEAHAYNHFYDDFTDPSSKGYLPPVRWITQRLLDGAVSRRVDAHYGVTDRSTLETRRLARRLFSRHLPLHQLSPYYALDELLGRWGLFGEAGQMLPPSNPAPEAAEGDPAAHLSRVQQLALGGALLPAFHGVWLRGAVLTHRGSGATVLLLGPRRSGKTTLALHCLAASPEVLVTAAENFFLCPGRYVAGMLGVSEPPSTPEGGAFLIASVPGSVSVGLGAVVGSLQSNPALSASVRPPALATPSAARQLLQNSDGVVWGMSQKFRVHLEETFPPLKGGGGRGEVPPGRPRTHPWGGSIGVGGGGAFSHGPGAGAFGDGKNPAGTGVGSFRTPGRKRFPRAGALSATQRLRWGSWGSTPQAYHG